MYAVGVSQRHNKGGLGSRLRVQKVNRNSFAVAKVIVKCVNLKAWSHERVNRAIGSRELIATCDGVTIYAQRKITLASGNLLARVKLNRGPPGFLVANSTQLVKQERK